MGEVFIKPFTEYEQVSLPTKLLSCKILSIVYNLVTNWQLPVHNLLI